MGRPATLDADMLVEAMAAYRDALRAHREALNRLNVYPVPDGDTGTNMLLTVESVLGEVSKLNGNHPPGSPGPHCMADVCRAVSHGSLMGARGNSGVILSQVLRGFSDVLAGGEDADADRVASALTEASSAAYRAVMRPVEGTILTVVREAASAARATAGQGAGLEEVLDAARRAAALALEETPKLLPVLAEAGVVDAGGSGFLLFIDALLAVLTGRPLPDPPEEPDAAAQAAGPLDISAHGEPDSPGEERDTVGDLRYEVMYLLEAPDDVIEAFKDVWSTIGDSIVVVGGDGLYNCHIHTDDIGAAIEAAVDVGRPRSIRVTDLAEQVGQLAGAHGTFVEEERWVREAASGTTVEEEGQDSLSPVACAVVAVANGPGIRRIFRSLGVQCIVHGGQSMNPSTQEIVDAIQSSPSGEVIVLPGNPNIVAVAEQAGKLSSKNVVVVPTRSIPQSLAALICYDPDAPADRNAAAMNDACQRAVYGEVTRAVRDASTEVGPVMEGDWIGISARGIEVVRASLVDASCALLAHLVGEDAEMVTIIEGEGATGADTRRITVWLSDYRPSVEVEVHHGGQPLYPYLFGVD
jgi:DAK2 domain fusion protein YloV